MKIVTTSISPDEPCYGLWEGPEAGRWIQKVWIIRNDTIAQYRTDYGPASNYLKVIPLVIPSYGDDKVGELMEEAEKNRHDNYWANRREEMLAESTLIPDAIRQEEEKTKQLLNKSVFGPGITIQRNRNNRQAIQRYLKEKHNGN